MSTPRSPSSRNPMWACASSSWTIDIAEPKLIARYPNLKEIFWVQEEPKNMGARRFMFTRNREREIVPDGVKLDYVGRPYRASTGEGYPAAHHIEQDRILREALTVT